MAGFIKLHRGWRDCPIFGSEFSRADAWVWLIEHATWKPGRARIKGQAVDLERGELTFSQRFLAQKWGWSKSRVDRFMSDLRAEGMIETRSKIGAITSHNAGQGQSIIKLCNYDKYQSEDVDERGNVEPESGATAGQQRGKEEEGKKERKEKSYAFEGRVIRLTKADKTNWSAAYSDLDLDALLRQRDDWLAEEARPTDRKSWFLSTSNWLAKKQQEAFTSRRKADEWVFSSPT